MILIARQFCPFTPQTEFCLAIAVITIITLGFQQDDMALLRSEDM